MECARLAGVNNYTIYNWLVLFGFHIRDVHESRMGDLNPAYGKRYGVALWAYQKKIAEQKTNETI